MREKNVPNIWARHSFVGALCQWTEYAVTWRQVSNAFFQTAYKRLLLRFFVVFIYSNCLSVRLLQSDCAKNVHFRLSGFGILHAFHSKNHELFKTFKTIFKIIIKIQRLYYSIDYSAAYLPFTTCHSCTLLTSHFKFIQSIAI